MHCRQKKFVNTNVCSRCGVFLVASGRYILTERTALVYRSKVEKEQNTTKG